MRKRNAARNNNTVPGFLSKTYKILENPEYAEIISWNEDGKAFKVKKPNEFAEKVLPKYFKTNNFASFVRQLNMYDFHKLRHDSEENEWKHRLFRRGYPNLLSEIKRKINETQIQDAVVSQKEQKKITNDTQYLLKEMVSLKQKQESLEKACGVLIAQNTQILGENKVLWGELNKKKEKGQKKIEKLFTLFLTYIGPKQIPELAFMNGKKPNEILHSHDYLKQEDLSDNDGDEDPLIIGRNHLGGGDSKRRWDNNDIANSLNGFPFNNNNNNISNNLASSLNGGMNTSNLMSSQNGGNEGKQLLPISQSGQTDQNVAQKFLDGLMLNLKSKQDGKQGMKVINNQSASSGNQFNSFVENYHKSNQDMLQNLSHFMNNQGGNQDLSSVDLNNQINSAVINPTQTTDLLSKRPMKNIINNNNNPFNTTGNNPAMLGGIISEDFDNGTDGLAASKKFKKSNNDVFNSMLPGNSNIGQFGDASNNMNNISTGGFNLDEYLLNNQHMNQSNAFPGFDLASVNNNRASLGLSKLFQNDFTTLALPQSTTIQPTSPTNKKPRNINNISIAPSTIQVDQSAQQAILSNIHKNLSQSGLNDSIHGFNPMNVNTNNNNNNNPGSNLFQRIPSQQQQNQQKQQTNLQWDDFNKFLQEQKIEETREEQVDNVRTNKQRGSNNNIIVNNETENCNEEFLAKDSVHKLNESIL